jgi:hypothetical protein
MRIDVGHFLRELIKGVKFVYIQTNIFRFLMNFKKLAYFGGGVILSALFVYLTLDTMNAMHEQNVLLKQQNLVLKQRSDFCDRIRQNYTFFVNEMEDVASKSTSELGKWFLGYGTSLVNKGCLTYEARYKPYQTPMFGNEHLQDCNRILNNGKASSVFGIRIRQNQEFSEDLTLFVRSVIAEVGWRYGKDVVLLQYVDHENAESSLPAEFAPFDVPHTSSDITLRFPNETMTLNQEYGGFSAIASYGHMSGLWYMKTNPEYSYMWIIEADVRALGPWDTLLKYIGSQEDFETTFPIEYTDPNWNHKSKKFKPEDRVNGLQVMYGTSRKYVLAAEKEIAMGMNEFLEGFLPAVASKNHLTGSYTALPVFGPLDVNYVFQHNDMGILPNWTIVRGTTAKVFTYGATIHCTGGGGGDRFYNDWKSNSETCLTNTIVHPVKL